MKELILQVKESEYEFLLKLLQQLNFVQVVEKPSLATLSAEKIEILKSIKTALEEVRMIRNGKLPRKALSAFLTELD